MAELWGVAGGMQEAQKYTQTQQMFGLQMQEGQQKLVEGGLDIQAKELAIKQTKLYQSQQDAMIKMLQGKSAGGDQAKGATDKSADMSNQLMEIADAARLAGRFDDAEKYSKTASTIAKNNAEIQA